MTTLRGGPERTRLVAAWGGTLLAWLTVLFVVAHGGRIANRGIQSLPRAAGGPYASTDYYLSPLGERASASLVAALDAIGPREEIWYVGPNASLEFHTTVAPLSYLAWPRPFHALACRPGGPIPGFIAGGRRDIVRPLLYFARPPATLSPSRAFAGTLRLANSRPDMHWTGYCSS